MEEVRMRLVRAVRPPVQEAQAQAQQAQAQAQQAQHHVLVVPESRWP
jgi:hypothetical protein